MRDIFEILFFLAGIAMPIIAIWALLYVKALTRHSEITAQQAQATLLLGLVDKWYAPDLHDSKLATLELDAQVHDFVFTQYKDYSEKELMAKLREHYKIVLNKLEIEDNKRYITMMRMLSFFEAVGHLVRNRYVLLTDIDSLFRGPILDVGAAWVLHLEDKQNRRGIPPGLYENAIFLFSEIEKLSSTL